MPVYQYGQLNTQALEAADLYVQIMPPAGISINGIPTNGLGLVGVGSWGPVNAVITAGSMAEVLQGVGNVTNRMHDLATGGQIARQLGVTSMMLVRVTDGTDVAASVDLMDTAATPVAGILLTAKYTGIVGNTITAYIAAGTAANTYKCVITRQGYAPEVFDNVGGTGATFWTNLANAINNGQTGLRGPSSIGTATAQSSTSAPNTTTVYALIGGTDGATGVTDATLLGADGTTRTGMYALRGSGAQVGTLLDAQTATQWPSQVSFALSEGLYMIDANPPSTSIANSASAVSTNGVDTYGLSVMVGDWCYWFDTANGVTRMLSPATFKACLVAAMGPQRSTLNKPINNIIGTQRTQSGVPYAQSDIAAAAQGRVDLITNPCPGGAYFGCRTGLNTSSNKETNQDNYTRMTNFLAFTLAMTMGIIVGDTITTTVYTDVEGGIGSFLHGLYDAKPQMIGNPNKPGAKNAYSVTCNSSNNTSQQESLGYLVCAVKVRYLNIVRFFLINLEGGGNVTVTIQNAA